MQEADYISRQKHETPIPTYVSFQRAVSHGVKNDAENGTRYNIAQRIKLDQTKKYARIGWENTCNVYSGATERGAYIDPKHYRPHSCRKLPPIFFHLFGNDEPVEDNNSQRMCVQGRQQIRQIALRDGETAKRYHHCASTACKRAVSRNDESVKQSRDMAERGLSTSCTTKVLSANQNSLLRQEIRRPNKGVQSIGTPLPSTSNRATNRPINNRLTNQLPVYPSTTHPSTHPPTDQRPDQPTKHSTSQLIANPPNQPINKPINRYTNQTTNRTNQPVNQPINQPTTNERTNELTN